MKKPRVFDLTVYISAPVSGGLNDWPANIQDGIYAALEKKSKELQIPLAIADARCDIDYGETTWKDKPYIHVVASEIIKVPKGEAYADTMLRSFLEQTGRPN